jgi:hypothetical protein
MDELEELRAEVERLRAVIERNRERYEKLQEAAKVAARDRDIYKARSEMLAAKLRNEKQDPLGPLGGLSEDAFARLFGGKKRGGS